MSDNGKNLGEKLYFSQFGGERSIPEQFIAAMERAETRQSGFEPDAEIPQEVKDDPNVVDAFFDIGERRTNEKVLVVVSKKDGNITLRDFRTTDQGQTVQVDSTLFYTTDPTFTRSYPSATQDVAIRDLGNRWSIQEVAVSGTWSMDDPPMFVPGIYQGIQLTARRDDPLPSFLQRGVPTDEVQSVVEGTVAQPTLGANDLEAIERQVGEAKKLLSRTTRDSVLLPVTEKITKEIEDLLPARFRALLPTTRTTTVESGTIATPTLETGELLRSEEQFSALVKLIEVVKRIGLTLPTTVSDTATITEYGGGLVVITSVIDVEGTMAPSEGEGVVSSKVTKLGEGHEVKETVTRYAGSWPERAFATLDEATRTIVLGTKKTVAKGSTTPGVSGDVVTEVKDIDGYREDKVVRTFPTSALDAYGRVLHTNTNVDLPAVLTNVNSYMQAHGGDGIYSESGSYSLGGNGSGGLDLSGNAQASAVIIPEIGYIIRTYNGNNVPCVHVLFLAPFGITRVNLITLVGTKLGTSVADWPKFSPQPVTLICRGQTSSIRVNATQRAHSSTRIDYLGAVKTTGEARTAGAGAQREVGVDVKVVRISPCIHGALSVGGDGSSVTPGAYTAVAGINSGAGQGLTQLSATAGVTGTVDFVQGSSATPGTHTSIPSTGLFVHRIVTEPDETRNRVRVMAEVVDFSLLV